MSAAEKLLRHGWETLPEIAARHPGGHDDAARILAAALQSGEAIAETFSGGQGWRIPMFRLNLPLLGERAA